MNQSIAPAPRSTFVNVLGWIFLAFSSLGVLVGLLQNIMLHTVFPKDVFTQIANDPRQPDMPAVTVWMIENMALVFGLGLLLALVHLVASIGLLRRLNWARLLFVGLMAFGILSNLGGLVFQALMMSDMHADFSQLHEASAGHMPDLGWFFIGIGVFSLLIALAFAALYAWIIKRLLSPQIAAEFRG